MAWDGGLLHPSPQDRLPMNKYYLLPNVILCLFCKSCGISPPKKINGKTTEQPSPQNYCVLEKREVCQIENFLPRMEKGQDFFSHPGLPPAGLAELIPERFCAQVSGQVTLLSFKSGVSLLLITVLDFHLPARLHCATQTAPATSQGEDPSHAELSLSCT